MNLPSTLLEQLTASASEIDRTSRWPAEQFAALADAGVLGWVIPQDFGGSNVSSRELIQGYLQLSAACLATTFILTQRNGACQRIAGSSNEQLQQQLLPDLAAGRTFATVGISHLTTSRQHIATPAVRAEFTDRGIRLDGTIPWVTGAPQADYIVTGGTCDDRRQVLVVLPTRLPGVEVQPFAELTALTASQTASVSVEGVIIPEDHLLAGPVEEVMKQGRGGGAGSLVTSTLALGLAQRAGEMIRAQAAQRADLIFIADQFESETGALRDDLFAAVDPEGSDTPPDAASIRKRANSLVLRITQAAMTISKGAGFVRGHPAELAVREALFFLVWSCPQPVAQGVLDELACREPGF